MTDDPRNATVMVERVARAMHEKALSDGWNGPPWEEMSAESGLQAIGLARAAIDALRPVPELCYDGYRCDKSWRDLSSTEVWNLWLDAALGET